MKGFKKAPTFCVEPLPLSDLAPLFAEHHAYKGTAKVATYALGVREDGEIRAAFLWMPPPFGAARSVCPEAPHAVLTLSRMVAVPRETRRFKLARVLKWTMRNSIDRVRWPVLTTYSDEGLGHTGATYRLAGWRPTARSLVAQFTRAGCRTSVYANGRCTREGLEPLGRAVIQRWEHWACSAEEIQPRMDAAGWKQHLIPGKVWRSGSPAKRWVKTGGERPGANTAMAALSAWQEEP